MIKASSSPSSGFTLLETLVSLTLTALIVTMLASMVRQYGLTWQAGLSRLDTLEEETLAQAILTRDLEASVLVISLDRNGYKSFEGTPDHVRFLTLAPLSVGGIPFYFIDYQLTATGGLVRSMTPYEAVTPLSALSVVAGETILSSQGQIRFSYRDKAGQEVSEWRDRDHPDAVILNILDDSKKVEKSWTIPLLPRSQRSCARFSTLKACDEFIKAKLREAAQ